MFIHNNLIQALSSGENKLLLTLVGAHNLAQRILERHAVYHIQSPVSSTVRFTVLRNNATTGIKYTTVLAQLCRVFWLLCERETQGQQPSPIQNNRCFHAVPPMPASKQKNNKRALLVSLLKKKGVIPKMCELTKFLYYSNIFPILKLKFQGTLLRYLFASLSIPLGSE